MQGDVMGFQAGKDMLSYNNTLVSAMNGLTPNDGATAYGVNAAELLSSVKTAINSVWVTEAKIVQKAFENSSEFVGPRSRFEEISLSIYGFRHLSNHFHWHIQNPLRNS